MKIRTLYLIYTPFLLVIFFGTANAHPHKSGEMDHGLSLENYQIGIDFTIDNTGNDLTSKGIKSVKKNKTKKFSKIKTTLKNDQIDLPQKTTKDKNQKNKEQ